MRARREGPRDGASGGGLTGSAHDGRTIAQPGAGTIRDDGPRSLRRRRSCVPSACWPMARSRGAARCPPVGAGRLRRRTRVAAARPHPIELTRVGKWLERVPDLRLDGERPTSRALAAPPGGVLAAVPDRPLRRRLDRVGRPAGGRDRADRPSATAGRPRRALARRPCAAWPVPASGGQRRARPRSTRTPCSQPSRTGSPRRS